MFDVVSPVLHSKASWLLVTVSSTGQLPSASMTGAVHPRLLVVAMTGGVGSLTTMSRWLAWGFVNVLTVRSYACPGSSPVTGNVVSLFVSVKPPEAGVLATTSSLNTS